VSARVEEGAVDLVIGTQALLRQPWKRLGLVVIDEQHKCAARDGGERGRCVHMGLGQAWEGSSGRAGPPGGRTPAPTRRLTPPHPAPRLAPARPQGSACASASSSRATWRTPCTRC
jgi:hypothetical protein